MNLVHQLDLTKLTYLLTLDVNSIYIIQGMTFRTYKTHAVNCQWQNKGIIDPESIRQTHPHKVVGGKGDISNKGATKV